MGQETGGGSFNETSVANANSAIDEYIDAVWAVVGSSQDSVVLGATIYIEATKTGDRFVYRMSITVEAVNSSTLKTNLDSLTTEFEDMVTDSGHADTIASVYGGCRITVNY